jgi:hypothetical protein
MRLLRIAVASLALLTVATAALAAGRLEPGTWPGAEVARGGPSAVVHQVTRTAAGITLTAASPTFTGSGTVTVGTQTFTIGTDAFATIQAAIDAVDPGGTVWVLPGTYLEAAAGRYLYSGAGPYQFGIFVGVDKPDLTIMGVGADGTPITSYAGVLSMVNTQARNTFGTSGFFIEGDHCTITGIGVGVNDLDPQKTIEVIGDDFTIKWCDLADVWGGVIYINDYRFNSGTNESYVRTYRVEGNNFQEGMDFQAASGAGYSGPVSGRFVTGNTFVMNPGQNWASITFNGAGGVSWFTYPVGGAIITGNAFTNTDPQGQHIKARGDYLNAQMDWAAWWNDNTYNRASCEGVAPPGDIRAYDYGAYTNARRIGAVIQDEIGQAVAGDIVLAKAGLYDERLTIDRQLTLRGATSGVSKRGYTVPPAYAYDTATESVIRPSTTLERAVVHVAADGAVFDGFVVANEVCATGGVYQDLVAIDQALAATTGVQVLNCVLGPNTNTALQDGTKGRGGVTVYGPHTQPVKLIVQHNLIFDSKGNGCGIMIVGPYGPTYHGGTSYTNYFAGTVIEDNDILGNHRSGIELAGGVQGGPAWADHLIIRNNLIAENGWYALAEKDNLKYGHGIMFIRAGSDRAYGDAAGARYVRLENNIIRDNEKSGLYVGPKNRDLFGVGNAVQDNGKGTGGYSLWDGVRVDLDELYYAPGTTYTDYGYLVNVSFKLGGILGNGALGLRVLQTPTLGPVDAGTDWWGAATPAAVAALVSSNVDYTPWLAAGDASGDPGFQADLSTLWVDDGSPQIGTSARIQEAIGLVIGSTVMVAPGSYPGNVVIDKKLVLQGAGDGNDPLVDTILLPGTGLGIDIQAGGSGATDRCVVRDLRVSGGTHGIYTNSALGHLTLQNLTVTGAVNYGIEIHNDAVVTDVVMTDVDLVSNVSTGMRVRGALDGLAMTNGHIDGNVFGLQSYTGAGVGNNFLHVVVTGTTFDNNSSKGMYFEKLSDALFDGVTVTNSGTAGLWAAGVDINLKYTAYQNIEVRNSTFTGCGTGDATNGVGIAVKARNDGSYAPCTLANVDLAGNTFAGCQNAIRFGEPGKNNPGPTVVDVHENRITGSVGMGLVNVSLNVPAATCNWWGDALGPDVPPANPSPGDGITGLATYSPWWTTASGPCDGFVPHVDPVTAGLCISTAHPCVTVPVVFTRADATPARGVSVTFQLGGGLTLCGTPALSILKGTWLDGYDVQYLVVDNGGGSYTVDQAINGLPCGATTGGQLFTLALTATSDGVGTVTITDVVVRDCDNASLPGIAGTPGEIPINVSVPAGITGLAASQVKTGNGGDGTTAIDVTWPAVEAGTTVHVYRADYGHYPEYDDLGGAVPATYPPGGIWTLAGDVTSGTTLRDEPPARGFWYYAAAVEDPCGNVSVVSNMTTGTLDYHLGDVMAATECAGDNAVDFGDISFLGWHYGVASTNPLYVACLDVGPTTNRSVNARPTTDNKINFEDLMMFAINYGTVSVTTQPVAAVASDAVWVEGPGQVVAGTTFTASLRQSGSGALLGLSASLGWDRGIAEPVSVEAGALVTSQGGVVLSGGGGVVDCALLGADRRLVGEGELARVTFRALANGAPKLTLAAVDARDAANRTLELTGTAPTVVPTVTSLAPAMPNPFRGTTTLSYALAKGGAVELAVYGVDGRKVATLASGVQEAGSYRLTWDGGNARPGLYYARLTTPQGRYNRTLVLVK